MIAKPRGVLTKGGMVKLSVVFDPVVFKKIKKRSRNKGFSATVNDLLKCGLLDIEESEMDDGIVPDENHNLKE
jgi:hypothetical protein